MDALRRFLDPVFPKLMYLSLMVGPGMAMPFLAPILANIGTMDRTFIGLAMGLLQCCPPLMSPVWGFVADYTARPKLLIATCAYVGLSTRALGLTFLSSFADATVLAIAVLVSTELVYCCVYSCTDAYVLKLLGARSTLFGKQRMWGALSWGLASTLGGWLYTSIIPLQYAMWMAPIALLPFAVVLWRAPLPEDDAARKNQKVERISVADAIRNTRLKWQNKVFFVVCFVAGIGSSGINTFLFLYLESLGGNSGLMGLCVLSMTLSECIFMYFTAEIAQRFGTFTCVLLALICYTLRLLFYAFMTNPWSVLPVEVLHGVTFGVFYSSAVAHVHTLASKEAAYFFQGVFTGVMSSGRALGSIGGGFLYFGYGARMHWRVLAFIMGVVSVLWGLVVLTDRGYPPGALAAKHSVEPTEMAVLPDVDEASPTLVDPESSASDDVE